MRVCLIVEAAAGGSGRCVLNLAQALAGQGDDVVVVYSPMRADDAFMTRLASMDRVHAEPFSMCRNPCLRDFRDSVRLFSILRRLGPFDVLHAHSSKAGGLLRLIGRFFPCSAIVYTPHAFYSMRGGLKGRVTGWGEWALSHLTDAVIVVSGDEYQHARTSLRVADKKLATIPNGIPSLTMPARETVRAARGWGDRETVLGFIGRFSPQKNPLRLMDVFGALNARRGPLRLALIGEGDLEGEIRARIAQDGLESSVQLIRGQDACDIVSGLDLLICSSDYEGFPLAFLESLQAGVPIATTPVGGAPEAVAAHATGFVSGDFTASSLTAIVDRYLNLPETERHAMVTRCREVAKRYTVDVMTQSVRELYASLVARKAKATS